MTTKNIFATEFSLGNTIDNKVRHFAKKYGDITKVEDTAAMFYGVWNEDDDTDVWTEENSNRVHYYVINFTDAPSKKFIKKGYKYITKFIENYNKKHNTSYKLDINY